MKKIIFGLLVCAFAITAHAQTHSTAKTSTVTAVPKQIVEASCGECKLGMKETGCSLAVRINGKSYLVTGNAQPLDKYGDAHAEHGMCNEIRKAEVEGEIRDGKFVATTFKLLPVKS